MAAILCNSLGSLCQGIGQVLTFPCRLCGIACDGCCHTLGMILASPFSPYLITTVALNFPQVVWGLRAVVGSSGGVNRCDGDMWLWVNSLLCLGHVLGAFYIVARIATAEEEHMQSLGGRHDPEMATAVTGTVVSETKESSATTTTSNYQTLHDESKNKSNTVLSFLSFSRDHPESSARAWHDTGSAYSWKRLQQVLCYDTVVAGYILLAIFWMIWQSMGVSKVLSSDQAADSDLCDSIQRWTGLSLTCGFIYCSLVCIAFSCSLCCLKHS